ncbi:MAG TPA: hypothetical protein VLJ41_01180 [Segetibacter sp.]|nr:hypothetical protein [Segetibacter sp.]
MEKISSFAKLVFVLAFIATAIGIGAFGQTIKEKNNLQKQGLSTNNDTSKNSNRNSNKDDSLMGFDQLDIQLKQLDLHMDQLKAELENLKLDGIQRQIDQAMKKVDEKAIKLEIDKSLKKIDWNGMNRQIDESIAKIDKAKMIELKKDMEKVKVQLENQKQDFHVRMPNIDSKKIRLNTEKAMKKAQLSMEKAREELTNLRAFTDALQSDGLIDKSKKYKVEVKDGELYIDGKKQPKEVSEKYKQYYRQKNFSINTNDGDSIRI